MQDAVFVVTQYHLLMHVCSSLDGGVAQVAFTILPGVRSCMACKFDLRSIFNFKIKVVRSETCLIEFPQNGLYAKQYYLHSVHLT